ncbi:LuxR family two component transcriptional regulator [Glutamicibacter mysorens]|uniref:LuxR family two component transcriptional regulator n=2 Tax=Glutamicibacter TaxID=1742989 RepID=A0ABX4MWS4_9MICC|nr:LuxR family two component transcriptional regulator [Glutamicibacter mysorens]GEC10820.1 DNA-binding response regulator [Glutamicibacter nicotianae]
MIRILLVDDHPIVRTGLRALFENFGDIAVIGEASSGEEALAFVKDNPVDVVLCDLRLGAGMNGAQTTVAIRKLSKPPHVLILTTFDKDSEILACIEAGAAGYLLKDVSAQTIVDSIRQAAAGHMVLAPEMAQRVVEGMRRPKIELTAREKDVLAQLATGAGNKQIAKALFVSEATVKTHLVHIFDKLQASSRTDAINKATEHGLL